MKLLSSQSKLPGDILNIPTHGSRMNKTDDLTKTQNIEEIWQDVLSHLSKKLKKPSFDTWIRPTKLISIDDSYATIAVKNEFARNFISQSFMEPLQNALKEILAASLGLRLVVDESIENTDEGQASIASIAEPSLKEEDKDLEQNFNIQILNKIRKVETNLIDKFMFENFVVGQSNEFSHKLAKAVADEKFMEAPVFVSSDSGLGKTHLMNAIGNEAKMHDKKVRYVNGEQFANELIDSIRKNNTYDFRKKYRELDLLLFDDLQFLQNKKSSQEEFFHTFNSISDKGGQIVVSADRSADALTLEPRLKSRLAGSVTAEIVRPDYDMRLQVLEHISLAENLDLSPDVLDILAKRFPNNIRELEGAVCRLNAYQSFSNEMIDDESVIKLFGSYRHGGPFHGLTIDKISTVVAKYFGIKLSDLTGTRRLKDFTKARHLAIYLAYDLLNISYSRIGEYFSHRKHSSIIHSVRLIKTEVMKDRSLGLMIDDIKSRFSA